MTALKALAAQLLAWMLVAAGCVVLGRPLAPSLPIAAVQGVLAAGIGMLLRSEPWWIAIHLAFSPALILALRLDLPPGIYLAVLAGLTFVFWTTFRGEVPLFLSSRATAEVVLGLLPRTDRLNVIDLGAGTGGLLRRLAQARPEARFTGIEHAPLPYLIAQFNARGLGNLSVQRTDLWRQPLHGQDVVYAFLSPLVMERLGDKARTEMRPGSLLISSCFPLPDAAPERVVEVPDRRGTRLYLYRMPGPAAK